MGRRKRKCLAFLLCVLMLLGTGTSALAEEATAEESSAEAQFADEPAVKEDSDEASYGDETTGGTEEAGETDMEPSGDTVTVDDTFSYQNENISAVISVSGEVTAREETENAKLPPDGELEMTVIPLGEDQPEYQSAEAYAEEEGEADNIIDIMALDLEFTCGGLPADVSACEITAEITPSEKLQEEAESLDVSDEIVGEAEIGIQLTALTSADAGTAEQLDSITVEKGAADVPEMEITLNAAEPNLQLVVRSALNPHFTVQYYGNLEMAVRDNSGYLQILNTDNGGENKGGNLPTNGGNTPVTGLYLIDADNGKREIQTEMVLTELYEENEYDYFNAPSLPYVNIFRDNGNYTANEVWVLKDGKDASSTNEADWDVYKGIVGATELHFTNNPDKAGDANTIYIKDGTVIRLVANQTTSDYNNDVTFYDYDITDDGHTTWDHINGQHGINSGSNYSGTGAKLAFGNRNMGTGLAGETWTDLQGKTNTLNAYNKGSLGGCTFGLVTGLDEKGHIQYADGINTPNLFDEEETATGKTTYNSGWSLGFKRSGDTYTLSSVNSEKGVELDELEQFNNPVTNEVPYTNIWTNNFWPMDKHSGKDGLTGEYNQHIYNPDTGANDAKAKQWYFGYDGNNYYPSSDDGLDHNNLFGMQYSVNFTLTEDYVGPLEYYFFGDDDMWVFLDGRLVCDIGGVHSSVGAYVNLWDYIEKGDAGTHTLKFYYTERGLSGSTCYMQFTLPSVSSVPPTYQNGQLKVQKEVEGNADSDAEFSFDISISSENGSAEQSDYAIVRYNADGSQQIETTLLTGGKGTFKLKAGEYVIIDYLQHGTTYIITETNVPDGCTVSSTVDNGNPNHSATVTGTTTQGKSNIVLFTNTFRPRLPDTGGPGVVVFGFGGMLLMGLAYAGIVYRKRKGVY